MTRGGDTFAATWLEAFAETIGGLVVSPGGALAVAAITAGELPLPGFLPATLLAAAAGCAVVAIVKGLMSFPARLGSAMVDANLTSRGGDGRVVRPARSGRERRRGDTTTTRWALPPGIGLDAVLERKPYLEERLDCELSCWMERGHLVVEAMCGRLPVHVDFDNFYTTTSLDRPSLLALGVARRGPVLVDLRHHAHLLIGGITGGGKSVALRQALTATLLAHGPDEIRLLAIDLKGGVELGIFDGLPHLVGADTGGERLDGAGTALPRVPPASHPPGSLCGRSGLPCPRCPALDPADPSGTKVVTTLEGASAALDALRPELDGRLSALRAQGAADLDDAIAMGLPTRPRVLVVVDELAELTARDTGESRAARDAQRAAVGRLCEIARLGRAVGIHLLVCTQRPDADVMPGQLKANLGGTVAFRVRSRVNSEILLEDDRAARLPHRAGRALWVHESIEEFQAVYIDRGEARRQLQERWLSTCTTGGGAILVTPHRQTPQSSSGSPDVRSPRGRSHGASRTGS